LDDPTPLGEHFAVEENYKGYDAPSAGIKKPGSLRGKVSRPAGARKRKERMLDNDFGEGGKMGASVAGRRITEKGCR